MAAQPGGLPEPGLLDRLPALHGALCSRKKVDAPRATGAAQAIGTGLRSVRVGDLADEEQEGQGDATEVPGDAEQAHCAPARKRPASRCLDPQERADDERGKNEAAQIALRSQ